ncbi:MAG TPA: PAS domain-containing protein, partial [Caldimonas sp.]|nr:PAS domain-containing protein [Caldimonas sp.]
MSSAEGPGKESSEPAGRSADAGWDHSERRSTLAALRTREQQYRAIFDGSIDGMVLWDEDLRVVDVNEAFVRMTGLHRDE